jgi:hypothetical protein
MMLRAWDARSPCRGPALQPPVGPVLVLVLVLVLRGFMLIMNL